jgi:rubrerythrin
MTPKDLDKSIAAARLWNCRKCFMVFSRKIHPTCPFCAKKAAELKDGALVLRSEDRRVKQ